jgi:hypothetical protein
LVPRVNHPKDLLPTSTTTAPSTTSKQTMGSSQLIINFSNSSKSQYLDQLCYL